MIDTLHLKSGRVPGAPGTTIRLEPITIFVGPNNSGKSKVLSEIEQYCRSGSYTSTPRLILESLEFTGASADKATAAVDRMTLVPNPGDTVYEDHIYIPYRDSSSGRIDVERRLLIRKIQNPAEDLSGFCQLIVDPKTLMLDGRTRIDLIDEQAAGDLQSQPQTSLQTLFQDDGKREEVRRIIERAFGRYFVVDPTHLGYLRIKFAEHPPSASEERCLNNEAIQYYAKALPIENFGDGVKAFTGMITELVAGDPQIVLVDEPEAFLHPPLAVRLGAELSKAAKTTDKRVFISTHSPAFVMGCVQSGVPLNIVRLTYQEGVATSRVLPSSEVSRLMRNPLLRSTGVLSGLFYEAVVVTEGDTDRAFYQEVNERLLRLKPEWGISNCLFINAQNKQTIHTIVNPLRKLGIPAAGVVDVDVMKEGGTVWTNLLKGIHIPTGSHKALSELRLSIHQASKAIEEDIGKKLKRDGGISVLGADEKETAENLLEQLANYGVFVVPGGELESWLKHLDVSGLKTDWLINMFERMGEDPDAPDYVRPADDDVWQFMSKTKAWLTDPKRKGIPS